MPAHWNEPPQEINLKAVERLKGDDGGCQGELKSSYKIYGELWGAVKGGKEGGERCHIVLGEAVTN